MINEGDLLWTPSPDKVAAANLTAFTGWLARERGLRFGSYGALWRWSVTDLPAFWQAIWDYCGVRASAPATGVLADGRKLTDATRRKICDQLREQYTPRHVPDRIIQVNDIPATLTGKKMEIPVRKLLLGVPLERAANVNAMANPSSLDEFINYAREQQDYQLG